MRHPTQQQKLSFIFILLCINLFLVYLYIFIVLLNYDIPWMVYEKLKTHLWILENGKQWHWGDIAKGLNTKVIEIDPNRLTRPLSNLVEVIDAKFRANLWDFMPPHPTLSLQWPFLFIGLPLLLYKFFRNMNCHPAVAFAGTCLYLTSSGFLSPIVQLSHPAKNMVNFFAIMTLATLTQLYRTVKTRGISIKSIPLFWPVFICSLFLTLITFLSDETGLFLFVMLGLIGFPLFLKIKEKFFLLCGYFLLPAVFFLIVRFFLPWLHFIVNHETIALNNYRDFPSISSFFFPDWHNLFLNAYLLFSVHPNLKWHFAPMSAHPYLIFLQCAYSVAFIALMALFILAVCKKKTILPRFKQVLAGMALMVCFIFFHTFQLSHNVRIWTVFWYGCLFSLIYYVTLTLILQMVWEAYNSDIIKITLPFVILVFALHGLLTSTYIFTTFKNQSNDPAHYHFPQIFEGKVNPYQFFDLSKSMQKSRCRYIYTLIYWSKVKNKGINTESYTNEIQNCLPVESADPYFQVDQIYFIIEAALEFPPGHSFVNEPDYVNAIIHQIGEPL